ncbi:MAG: molybdopterin-dependent oxidoreductase, partial [Gemmatimonadota bacterium]
MSRRATTTTSRVEEVDGLCGICPAGCWVTVQLEDGEIRGARPLKDHPLGMICTNGVHSAEIVHDPDRLKYPMRRVGPKGTFEFERISWDEAFEIIVQKLHDVKAEHGAEATAIYTGRGGFELSLCNVFQPDGVAVSSASSVLFPFGSPNTLGVGALCYVSFAMIAPHVTMGEMLITMDTDIEQAELIVVWGSNPATDSPPLAHEQIKRAQLRGAEVVVIDPR